MSHPRLALLNAAHDPADSRRNFRRELDAEIVEYHLPAGEIPDTVDVDGAVITGSKASVYWEDDWIDATTDWVADAIDRQIPLLGVCFGHQLVATTIGGTVEAMDEYELGYRTVHHRGKSPLFAGIDPEFTVFVSHSDRVSTLPKDARCLASNDYGIHAFQRDQVFGVQFHPEYDAATATSVTEGKEGEIPTHRIRDVLGTITPSNVDAARQAKRIFENFMACVRDRWDCPASLRPSPVGK